MEMDRRRFLKLAGLATAGAFVQLSFMGGSARTTLAASSPGGKLYRGDSRGKIHVSADGGANWKLHTNLGPNYSVDRMVKDHRGRVGAAVGYRGRQFKLKLAADEKSWHTA
jgi:hypothetical protein